MIEPEDLRPEIAAFLAAEVAAGTACRAFGAILPTALYERARPWQRRCHEAGWAGLHWPTQYGGRGLTTAHTAVWFEECAKARVAPYLNLQGLVLAGGAIMKFGTDAQKEKFLRPTLSGDILWCQLFSEPDAGSDLAGLATVAERDGDQYRVTGQKVWSSNAQFAEYGILMARTDPDAPKHKGISFFLFDMTAPGVEVRPLKQATGDSEFCEVFLDGAPMPTDALLGPEHDGWNVGALGPGGRARVTGSERTHRIRPAPAGDARSR